MGVFDMGNSRLVQESRNKFEIYTAVYDTLQKLRGKQAKELCRAIKVMSSGETDCIYLTSAELQPTVTGRVRIQHWLAIADNIHVDEDAIELKLSERISLNHPKIHYYLSVPWMTKDSGETGTVTVEVLIGPNKIIDSSFISMVSPVLQERETLYLTDLDDGPLNQLEIQVNLEPDIVHNAITSIDLLNRHIPFIKNSATDPRRTSDGSVSANDSADTGSESYEELLRRIEDHIKIGQELTRAVARWRTMQKTEENIQKAERGNRDAWF